MLRTPPQGFTLVEVLVAVAVVAIGLLGIAALQVQGVRFNFDSYSRSQATVLANDYLERMYANRPGVNQGFYADFDSEDLDCDEPPATTCGRQRNKATPDACTPQAMGEYDRYILVCGYPTSDARFGGVRDLLLNGRLQVDCLDADGNVLAPCSVAASRHRIRLSWDERGTTSGNQQTVQRASFEMVAQP